MTSKDNDVFIDMMEEYYGQPYEDKEKDIRSEFHYQVGTTPNGIEQARNHCDKVDNMTGPDRPISECPPGVDPKWRFFWRMGEVPPKTEFKALNADPVLPKAFPQWPKVMNSWGSLMVGAIETAAEMAALGFGLEQDAFTSLMKFGPHLLAPTGSDLSKHGEKGTVFANYHYDLNFITIHGKSRFPGLRAWTREGKLVNLKVPEGCLLIQAGKQFEYLTAGKVLAGFHEVVVMPKTLEKIEQCKKEGKSLWRVSSTLFGHIASDNSLEPLGHFKTKETEKEYPSIKAGHHVQAELDAIKLGVTKEVKSSPRVAKKQKV